MQLAVKKEFGDGSNIHMLHDPWLHTEPPRSPVLRHDALRVSGSISFYKSANSEDWNINRLQEDFGDSEAKLICQIKPSLQNQQQHYSWIYSKSGEYTVKAGYWLWYNRLYSQENRLQTEFPTLDILRHQVWTVKAPPKLQHFLWRILSNILATNCSLAQKKVTRDRSCPRCATVEEDTNHILFSCPFARVMWALTPAGGFFYPSPSHSIYANIATCLSLNDVEHDDKDRLRYWPWILWKIWKCRNAFLFRNDTVQPDLAVTQAHSEAHNWFSSNQNITPPILTLNLRHGPRHWVCPPSGKLKCSIDASWETNGTTTGIGWIIRDSQGLVKMFGAKSLPHLLSPIHAEAAALVWALSCANILMYTQVIFESDCQALVSATKEPHRWPSLSNYLYDIQFLKGRMEGSCIQFIPRTANLVADAIARQARSGQAYFSYVDSYLPFWLLNLVNQDSQNIM